jgi:hypothetical protein
MALTTETIEASHQNRDAKELVEHDSVAGGFRKEVVIRPPAGATGTAMSIADGADITQGAKGDAAATTDTGTFSLIALFKRLLQKFTTQLPAALDTSGALKVGNSPLSIAIEGSHTRNASIDTAATISPTGDYLILQATIAGKNVRMTFDGTAPTATLGFQLIAGDPPVRIPTLGKTFKVIAETAGADVQYQNEQGV